MVTPGLSNRGANQICRHIVVHLRVGTVLDGSMGRGKSLTFALEKTGKTWKIHGRIFPADTCPMNFLSFTLMYY
jgi:hypothetical protein